MTYHQLLKETAEELGYKRSFYNVPFFTPGLSKLWAPHYEYSKKFSIPSDPKFKTRDGSRRKKLLKIPNYTFKSFKESIESSVDLEDHHKKPFSGLI